MRRSLPTLILISIVSIVGAASFEDGPFCCGQNSSIHFEWQNGRSHQCENGQNLTISCHISDIMTLNFYHEDFIFQTDDDGSQMYVDTYTIVHSPYYCVGYRLHNFEPLQGKIVLGCKNHIIPRNRPVLKDIIFTIVALLFLVSGIFSTLTAVIYFLIPQTQDIEGKCTFHLTTSQSLAYFLGSYWCLRIGTMEVTLLDEFCITHWYLFMFFVLSFVIWSTVLAFHIWSRFKDNLRTDESKLMLRYLIIGYGIPGALVLVSCIHINTFHKSDFGNDACEAHRRTMFGLYAALPVLISQLTSAYLFVNLQRRLWSAQPTSSPENSTSQLKKFRFRFFLNAKLFILTGLPLLLIIFCYYLQGARVFQYLGAAIFFFIACEGVVVFCMLVVCRKRILRGIAGMFGITGTRWEACPESEEEGIVYANENENQLGREL